MQHYRSLVFAAVVSRSIFLFAILRISRPALGEIESWIRDTVPRNYSSEETLTDNFQDFEIQAQAIDAHSGMRL